MSVTQDSFKNLKAGDKVAVYINGSRSEGYFKSADGNKITYEDRNFVEHTYAYSELSDPPPLPSPTPPYPPQSPPQIMTP
jgi:hypothetical protein